MTILTNSIEGNSLSLLMQQTVQGGCQTVGGCQQALVGNALRGDLLGLEDWASITAVLAEPPTSFIEVTENNTVRIKRRLLQPHECTQAATPCTQAAAPYSHTATPCPSGAHALQRSHAHLRWRAARCEPLQSHH
jgi:hypothetical protein